MTRKEYLEFHKRFCSEMVDVTAKKNADYTAGSDDPFANFRLIEKQTHGRVSTEDGMMTRISDKMSRLNSFLAKHQFKVVDESVFDTLLDMSNYCALMAGVISERIQNARTDAGPKQADAVCEKREETFDSADRSNRKPNSCSRL